MKFPARAAVLGIVGTFFGVAPIFALLFIFSLDQAWPKPDNIWNIGSNWVGLVSTVLQGIVMGAAIGIIIAIYTKSKETGSSMRAFLFAATLVVAVIWRPGLGLAEKRLLNRYTVSLPQITLPRQERVIRFDCKLEGPLLLSINTPVGWQMKIENSTSNIEHGTATVEANIVDGVAAFTDEDLKTYFQKFMRVSAQTTLSQTIGEVDIVVRVWVATTQDMTKYRKLTFRKNELILEKD